MRITLPRSFAAIAATVAALLAAGCGSSSTPSGGGGGAGGGNLVVAVDSGVTTLDPAQACTAFYDYQIVKNLYDNLVDFGSATDANGQHRIVPALASSWKLSADKRTYTFTLRPGVKFADGTPLRASDVVFTLKRNISKGGCQGYVITFADDITSIKANGDSEVSITTKKPDPLLLQQLAQTGEGPINEKLLQAHGGLSKAGDQWLASHSAGTGAYQVSSYRPDSQIKLTASPNYWRGKPKSSSVTINVITDPTSLRTFAQSGQADMTYGINLKDVQAMQDAGQQIIANEVPYYVYLGLNNKAPELSKPAVRKAITDAISVDAIDKAFGYGHAKTFAGPIPPSMPFFPSLPVPQQNVAQAKQELASAGVHGMKLKIDVIEGKQITSDVATVVQDNLKAIGVDATIDTLGSSAFFDRVSGFKAQAWILLDGAPLNDPAYLLGYLITCKNDFNWSQYCNTGIDKLLAKGAATFDAAKRADIYKQVAQQFVDDPGLVPIFAPDQIIVAKPSVKGYVAYPDGQGLFRDISK